MAVSFLHALESTTTLCGSEDAIDGAAVGGSGKAVRRNTPAAADAASDDEAPLWAFVVFFFFFFFADEFEASVERLRFF